MNKSKLATWLKRCIIRLRSSSRPTYALSIRQPWATLILHGLKTIEIRSWATDRRERIWLHVGKVVDRRKVAWRHIPAELRSETELRGGLIGTVEITGCIVYSDRAQFAADRQLHRNEVDWYRAPLYGFLLSRPEPAEFRPLLGNIKFFPVPRRMR